MTTHTTQAADFDSLQAAVRHEYSVAPEQDKPLMYVLRSGNALRSNAYLLRPRSSGRGVLFGELRWDKYVIFFEAGKYHVTRMPTGKELREVPVGAVKVEKFLESGAGLVQMTAESAPTAAETAPVLYERGASISDATRAKKNKEGLTYAEWYDAANAFGQVINPEKARTEWATGVDPTEWAARVRATTPSKARALVWHRNKKGGLYAENYDVKPSKGPRGGDGWWRVVKDGHVAVAGPIHLIADAKAAAQADYDFIVQAHTTPPTVASERAASSALCVPFVKVTRDVENYEACLARAHAIGPIKDAATVYKLLRDVLAKEDQEVFLVVLIDVRDQLRGVAEVHRGARSMVVVSEQDIFRPVIVAGAEKFIVVHNHPSSKADPSDSDITLTKKIAKAARVFGRSMSFEDHVIIGLNEYYSFRKHDPSLFQKRGEG